MKGLEVETDLVPRGQIIISVVRPGLLKLCCCRCAPILRGLSLKHTGAVATIHCAQDMSSVCAHLLEGGYIPVLQVSFSFTDIRTALHDVM
jgi:hypothetical protein